MASQVKPNIRFNQSELQCFYFVENAPAKIGELIIAYNGNIPVGYRSWNGPDTDIPAMGNDNSDLTKGYLNTGDIPNFKLLKKSGNLVNLSGDIPGWENLEFKNIRLQ